MDSLMDFLMSDGLSEAFDVVRHLHSPGGARDADAPVTACRDHLALPTLTGWHQQCRRITTIYRNYIALHHYRPDT